MRALFATFIFSAATLCLAGFALASSLEELPKPASVEEGPKPASPSTPSIHSNLSVRVSLCVLGVDFIRVRFSDSDFRS